jgi:hypothetical protein
MKIISVVGARPNFMKIAPFINAINEINSASFPPSGGNPGVRDKGWQGKGVNAVNTASSPTFGGDASVRPEAQEAEGVKCHSRSEYRFFSPPPGEPEGASPPLGTG